ncbi:hypothetical protein V8C86DRAFT_2593396 [Haematococcus lacustris]
MADWSSFNQSSSTAECVGGDGSTAPDRYFWEPRQWTLLFSLWINCPPFKIMFLNRLVEELLVLMRPSQHAEVDCTLADARDTSQSAQSEATGLGLQEIALHSPPPSTPPSCGSANDWSTGAQASGGQAQLADEPSTQHSPATPTPSSAEATAWQEAVLALALLRMGLPGNMFECGAPLHPHLQFALAQWGRWEWYTNILRSARLGRGSCEPLPGPEAPQSQLNVQGFGQQSQQQQQLLQHNTTLGQGTSDSAGSAGQSEPPDDVTALLLSVQFAVEHEEAFLEALHLAGCPYDLHTQLRLPKSWPVNNDSTKAGQLQQLLMGTVEALVQLPDAGVLGPGIMAATAGVVSHRRKVFDMYATPPNGSSSDSGSPWPGDPSPNSPTAFKRDVSIAVGADFLLQCASTSTDKPDTRSAVDVTGPVVPMSTSRTIGFARRGGVGGEGKGGKGQSHKKKKQAKRKG